MSTWSYPRRGVAHTKTGLLPSEAGGQPGRYPFRGLTSPKGLTVLLGLALCAPVLGANQPGFPSKLRIAVAQVGLSPDLEANLRKILRYVDDAARQHARVVVFPEGALRTLPEEPDPQSHAVYLTLSRAARQHRVYLILGAYHLPGRERGRNVMKVIDPQGQEIFHYTKLYDENLGTIPETFLVDGVRASGVICADRWLRSVAELPVMEGAQIVFELSGNLRKEWVESLEWFWYVPWALRNQVFVVFANTAYNPEGPGSGHGHSAIIRPNGQVLAAIPDDRESLLIADIDPNEATRQEALRRYTHPVLGPFWQSGRAISRSQPPNRAEWPSETSPEISIQVTAAQIAVAPSVDKNLERMRAAIIQAAREGSDVVVFPELAVSGWDEQLIRKLSPAILRKAHELLQELARQHHIWVIYGAPKPVDASGSQPGWANAAYVVDDQGRRATEYEQIVVSRPGLFRAGRCPERMRFRIKGVPATVTLGREILWSELAELSAFSGVQLLFHLAYIRPEDGWTSLTWQQIQIGYASFLTFTTVVNAARSSDPPAIGGTAIWDDLRGREEIRAALGRASLPLAAEPVELFTHWGANRVRQLGGEPGLIHARRTVNRKNPLPYPRYNRRMIPWYERGAELLRQCPSP